MPDARLETGTATIARKKEALRRTPMLQDLAGDCDRCRIRMQTRHIIQ